MNPIATLDFIDVPSRREMEESMTRKYLRNDTLGFTIKDHVIVNGSGIIKKDDGSSSNHLDGTLVFLGEWLSIWGHCITDNLKRLWFLKSQYFNDLRGGGWISCFTPIHKNFTYLLNILGIDADKIKIISENTLVDKLIIPDDSIIVEGNYRYYYPEYALIVNEIRNSIPIDNTLPEKVYFTRTKLKKKKDFGEELIEDVFKKLGFEIFSPEKLTIAEQLKLLRNCKELATTEGSVAHNVIFCNDNVHMIIVRKICAMISYQFILNEIRKAQTTYIDAHNTLAYVGAPWDGPFLLKRNHNLIDFASRRGLTGLRPKLSIVALLNYGKNITYKFLRYRKRIYLTRNIGYFVKQFFR